MGEHGVFSVHVDGSVGSATVVRLSGELDLAGIPELERVLLAVTDGDIVVDLTDLSFIDSGGLRVLISAYKRRMERGESITLCAPGRQVARVLRLSGLDTVFAIEPAVAPGFDLDATG